MNQWRNFCDFMDEMCANYLMLRWNRGFQICWIIVMIFISGAKSPQNETFPDIIKFRVFSYSDLYLRGLYFVKMRLGNPPQELMALVDTGSDLAWVNCPSNETIGKRSYHLGNSATASLVPCSKPPCTFHVEYYDRSSVSGFYVNDALHYETTFFRNSFTNIVFGCGVNRNELIKSEIEGILGLGPGNVSAVAQLSSQHLAPRIFSHCLASRGDGFLIFGQVQDPALVYTPIISKSTYKVALESIAVNGGEPLAIDPRVFRAEHGTLVDSGAQISLLAVEAYDLLVNSVSAYLNQSSYLGRFAARCYLVSAREIFPTLHFIFHGGAVLNLRPNYYLFQDVFDGRGGWCINFRREKDVTILGAPALRDKIITYDLTHGRIGWVDHDCSKPVNVSLIYDVGNEAVRRKMRRSIVMAAILIYLNF